jgi:hypothetical protein
MTAVAPLLAAAALVGVLHMSAPDHWVTLCLLGKNARWSRSRLLSVSVVTAAGHVGLSLLLGFVIIEMGLIFSQVISGYLTEGTGAVMVVAGLYYGIKTALSHQEEDYELDAEKEEAKIQSGRSVRYFAVLGGALSPDLSILPIFLLAVSSGTRVEASIASVFATASILSLILLVLAGSVGLSKVFERVPPKYNDSLVGFVIAVVGVYIILFG